MKTIWLVLLCAWVAIFGALWGNNFKEVSYEPCCYCIDSFTICSYTCVY